MNWKRFLKSLIVGLTLLLAIIAGLVAPIDYTPLKDQPYYTKMRQKLDTFQLNKFPASKPLSVGWSKFSIVPDHPVVMSGYQPRAKFTDVHDTLYARVMSINNGSLTTYFVTVDLLIFPPTLKKMINNRLKFSASQYVYFSASHTHTGVGGWDTSLLGNFLMGGYREEWMKQVADGVVAHMQLADENSEDAMLFSWEADAAKYVSHRIDKTGESPTDGMLRGISVIRGDSTKALLFSYNMHPTLISKKGTSLSGDYPAAVISALYPKYEYTQFMAGMVGSHTIMGYDDMLEFELTSAIGESLASIIGTADQTSLAPLLDINNGVIKVEHGSSQLRLTENIKLRNWVFEKLIGPLTGEIRILKIGNILLIGTSCDFSGEIFLTKKLKEKAAASGMQLIITSFNGEYTGYITDDKHYDESAHEEVRSLNWVGPYFGAYYAEIIETLIDKATE